MDKTMQLTREIPVNSDYDIVVVGGGPAGCTAAAAAAREGARTLLIEATGCLGGMGTSGLVPAWCPFSDGEKIIYRGLADRVRRESNLGTWGIKEDAHHWVPINPENLKLVYDNLVTEFGVTTLFNTLVTGMETAGPGQADSIILSNKAGLSAVSAKVFVDCTGDADLANYAGALLVKGDEADGDLQPATHCFVLGNVNMDAYRNGPALHAGNPDSPIYKIIESGKYPLIPDLHLCNNAVGPDAVGFNAGHLWDVDNTNPASVSEALMHGRKMAGEFLRALKDALPGAFGNAFVAKTAPLLGIRETRRIVGDYNLTIDDFTSLRSFDDEIGRNCYFIDVHHKKEEVGSDDEVAINRHVRLKDGESHGIPYRCLTPKGIKNIITAGRCISTDRSVNGSVRVMPVCLVTGEAAGLAAAMAANSNDTDIHTVDTVALRSRLKAEGAWLPENAG